MERGPEGGESRHTTHGCKKPELVAVDALREITSAGESESARVSAARTILEMAIKAADVEDIQKRLDSVEQALKKENPMTEKSKKRLENIEAAIGANDRAKMPRWIVTSAIPPGRDTRGKGSP
ncbi:MAG TPA: hypothetical protein VIY49_20040 [Bryobacteraceae bacterium]